MIVLSEFLVRVFGMVRDHPKGSYYKGHLATYFCADEARALMVCERACLNARTERMEICRYDRDEGLFVISQTFFAKSFREARGIIEPDLFFKGRKKSSQTTLDRAGVKFS